jgi:broad specificity phosphatase PhoE
MPKRVYLIRHGEAEGTREQRFLGSTDAPLTAWGAEQVQRLARLLSAKVGEPGTRIWCVASPLLRAQQTAAAVAARYGLRVDTDPDLREMDFGEWEGLTSSEVEERYPGRQALWASPAEDAAFPGGESLRDFDRRIDRALGRIRARDVDVAFVCAHGGVNRALAGELLGLGRERFWLLNVQPASVVRVDVYGEEAVLSELWCVSDREGE